MATAHLRKSPNALCATTHSDESLAAPNVWPTLGWAMGQVTAEGGSELGEGRGVAKRARQVRRAAAQRSRLKVAAPTRVGRSDAELRGGRKAKALVKDRIAEQSDQPLASGICCTEYGVHERVPDPTMLVVGEHTDRPQPERRGLIDMPARAHHVADHVVVGEGNQGQRLKPASVATQLGDQPGFRRLARIRGSPERGGSYRGDHLRVAGHLAAN